MLAKGGERTGRLLLFRALWITVPSLERFFVRIQTMGETSKVPIAGDRWLRERKVNLY